MGVSYSSVRPQMVRAAPQLGGGTAGLPPRGRVASNPGSLPALLLTNNFDGGSNTTTISTGNSGGASGNAFDLVAIGTSDTLTYSNTTYATGSLSAQIAIGGTSSNSQLNWQYRSIGSQPKLWFRACVFIPSLPPSSGFHFLRFTQSNGSPVAQIGITQTGTLNVLNSGGGTVLISTYSVPVNAWYRVEGWITGSAAQGQISLSLFTTPTAQVPLETDLSAATQGFGGPISVTQWGVTSNYTNYTFYLDSVGISNTAPLGPVSFPGPASLGKPGRAVIPGRIIGGGRVSARFRTPPYVPPVPPPPVTVAPAVDASPLPSLITTFPGTL